MASFRLCPEKFTPCTPLTHRLNSWIRLRCKLIVQLGWQLRKKTCTQWRRTNQSFTKSYRLWVIRNQTTNSQCVHSFKCLYVFIKQWRDRRLCIHSLLLFLLLLLNVLLALHMYTFDGLIVGADCLPWWSPNQVLTTNYYLCVCVYTASYGIYHSGQS